MENISHRFHTQKCNCVSRSWLTAWSKSSEKWVIGPDSLHWARVLKSESLHGSVLTRCMEQEFWEVSREYGSVTHGAKVWKVYFFEWFCFVSLTNIHYKNSNIPHSRRTLVLLLWDKLLTKCAVCSLHAPARSCRNNQTRKIRSRWFQAQIGCLFYAFVVGSVWMYWRIKNFKVTMGW